MHIPSIAVVAALAAAPSFAQAVMVGDGRPESPASARLADALGSAAMKGDVVSVKALLAKGADPNAKSSVEKSALRSATSLGCMMAKEEDVLAVVDVLLAAGANVNEVDDFGLSVLLMAAQKCKAPVIERLLAAGGDTEVRSPQGYTPLAMAFIVQNHDAAEALVAHGARLSPESIAKLFAEPPDDPKVAALVKRATAAAAPAPKPTARPRATRTPTR